MISCDFSFVKAFNLFLEFCFSFVSLRFFSLVNGPFFFLCVCALFIVENQGNQRSRARIFQIRKLHFAIYCVSRNFFCHCSKIAIATGATATLKHLQCSRLVLILCSSILSLFLQAYCSSIPSLKFELPITYNCS